MQWGILSKGETLLQCRGAENHPYLASTCNTVCKESVFNVQFLVLDFPLGTPFIPLKQVFERSIGGGVGDCSLGGSSFGFVMFVYSVLESEFYTY